MSDHDHPTNPAIRLTDGAFYGDDPHENLKRMRENAPVYWDEAGQVWGITLYEEEKGTGYFSVSKFLTSLEEDLEKCLSLFRPQKKGWCGRV